ncbi:MAG: WG repeat-containing protein [Clostridia bacterium]|nr:WG repeat-containing protein [Clostridia bacterium]
MKTKVIIRNIISRITAALLFFAVCLPVLAYSAGMFTIPFINSKPPVPPVGTEELSRIEDTIKELTSGQNISGITLPSSEPVSGTDSPGTEAPGTATESGPASDTETSGGNTPPAPPSMQEYLSKGYRLSWDSWSDSFVLAEIGLEEGPVPGIGTVSDVTKTVTERKPIVYEGNGIEFLSFVTSVENRNCVELYMGFIIVPVKNADATGLFPVPFVPEDAEAVTEADGTVVPPEPVTVPGVREQLTGVDAVAIYSSEGRLIGIYPSKDIEPAYTREEGGAPLFRYKDGYIRLNTETGDFEESDYVDERDNRGLYFDYNPDFGTTDNNYKKWSVKVDVTLAYTIDKAYHYARFGIDWRITRALYLADPDYAEIVAKEVSPGRYYNLPFRMTLKQVKKDLAEESKAALTATTEPVTEPLSPETQEPMTETSPVTAEDITPPEETLREPPAETIAESDAVPGNDTPDSSPSAGTDTGSDTVAADAGTGSPGTEPLPEDITVPETLPAAPGTDSESVPPSETTAEISDSASGSAPADSGQESGASGSDTSAGIEDTVPEETIPEETTENTKIDVSTVFSAYRFAFGRTQPVIDYTETGSLSSYMSVYIDQLVTWPTSYRYAKAYNFREGRAYTVDDNGVVRIINIYGGSPIYVNYNYYPEQFDIGTYVRSFYIEPFYRDVSMLGHFYFDEGLIRIRHVEQQSHNTCYYITDEDILVDIWGKAYEIPTGFNLVSYSEGILILERNGLYGCYHKDGYWIAQPIYSSAEPFIEGLCVLGLSDGTKGMIDKSGNIVLPFAYEHITNASSGVIACYSADTGWRTLAKMKKG